MIEFGQWMPDLPMVRAPHLRTASGCIPTLEAYGPFQGQTEVTNALDNRCKGAFCITDILDAQHVYAGDTTKLYQLLSFSWVDASKTGGYGPISDNARWNFATFGDRLLATNKVNPIQYIDMSTAATQFADLPGSPPLAEFVTAYSEFVVLGATDSSNMKIRWSGFANSAQWTPGTNQSDEQEFPDGGRITGFGSLDVLYIFQERAIRRMNYVGGATIMTIDKIVTGPGCIEPNSLCQWGRLFFYLAEDGFYMFDGETPTPIGAGRFDKWFRDNSQPDLWPRMSAVIDPRKKLVCWSFCSDGNTTGVPDTMLIYNWVSQRATVAYIDIEVLVSAASLGVSPDDLTSTDVDAMTVSFDDPFWLGGTSYLAGFSTSHKMGSVVTGSGDSLQATLETGDTMLGGQGRSTVEWMRPLTDAPTATIAASASLKPTDTPTYTGTVSMQPSGRCPLRGVNGNFTRAKLTIPAGAAWTFANGVDLKAKPAGAR
jgi:hypothetical protein